MLIGQPGIPVRLFYDAGDDNTGLYVRAAIFSEGTTSGPASLTTVNLTYNATYDGYTALYTPPYGYDRLIIKYSVYSDSGYTTRDLAYPRVNDQLVMNGYSAGGGGVVRPIEEEDFARLAEAVWRADLTKYVAGTAGSLVLKGMTVLVGPLLSGLTALKKSFSFIDQAIRGYSTKVDTAISGSSQAREEAFEGVRNLIKSLQRDVFGATQGISRLGAQMRDSEGAMGVKMGSLSDQLSQQVGMHAALGNIERSVRLLEMISMFDKRLATYLAERKNPSAQDIAALFESLVKKSGEMTSEQTEFLKSYLNNTVIRLITDVNADSVRRTVGQLEMMKITGSKENEALGKAVTELKDQVKAADQKIDTLKQEGDRSKQEIILSVQNNAIALLENLRAMGLQPEQMSALERGIKNLTSRFEAV